MSNQSRGEERMEAEEIGVSRNKFNRFEDEGNRD